MLCTLSLLPGFISWCNWAAQIPEWPEFYFSPVLTCASNWKQCKEWFPDIISFLWNWASRHSLSQKAGCANSVQTNVTVITCELLVYCTCLLGPQQAHGCLLTLSRKMHILDSWRASFLSCCSLMVNTACRCSCPDPEDERLHEEKMYQSC